MKKSIVLLVAAMVLNVTFASAKTLNPRKRYVNTVMEISQLLTPTYEVMALEEDVKVVVKVLMTQTGELVVLQTSTDNEALSNYIKYTLNYKKLTSDEIAPGSEYEFEVNFKS